MRTPVFIILSLFVLALVYSTGCNMPALKKPVFSARADTIFVKYQEIYQSESMYLNWSMTTDSIAKLTVRILNSSRFTFEQKADLEKTSKYFSSELLSTLANANEFASITILHEWKGVVMSRTFSIEYPTTQGTSATVMMQPGLSESGTTTGTVLY